MQSVWTHLIKNRGLCGVITNSAHVEVGSREREPDVVSYKQHTLCWADEIHLTVFTIDFPYQISSGGL
jgi:hypothetical protein